MRIFRFLFLGLVLEGLYFLYQHYSSEGLFEKKTDQTASVLDEQTKEGPKVLLSAREELTSFVISRKNL